MALKAGEKYRCFYCEKIYSKPEEADSCRESHNLVYIPASREDLDKLIMFLSSGERRLLIGVKLIELLFQYARRPKREVLDLQERDDG